MKYSPEYAATLDEKARKAYMRDLLRQTMEEQRFRYEAIGRAVE